MPHSHRLHLSTGECLDFIVCLAFWGVEPGVEPNVSHQITQLGITGEFGMQQNQRFWPNDETNV